MISSGGGQRSLLNVSPLPTFIDIVWSNNMRHKSVHNTELLYIVIFLFMNATLNRTPNT